MRTKGGGLTLAAASVALSFFAGCPADRPPPRAPERNPADVAPPGPPPRKPPEYVLADPDANGRVTSLGPGAWALLVQGTRVVLRDGDVRVATDPIDSSIGTYEAIPEALGGGFVFAASSALYTATSFDGTPKPLVSLPEGASRIAFGPKSMFLRSGGERWLLDPTTGDVLPMSPPGLVSIATASNGRALAITAAGDLLATIDRGATYADVTSQLGASPSDVRVVRGDAWATDTAGRFAKLEAGGALRQYDQIPDEPPVRVRPKDPRWHSREPILQAAVQRGARLDDTSALLADSGDVLRVDLRTGEISAIASGRLPPSMRCEATRAGDELLVVCVDDHGALVATVQPSNGEDALKIERSFPSPGRFVAGDDGGLAIVAPCDRAVAPGSVETETVCARGAHGEWSEHRFVPPGGIAPLDAGAPLAPQLPPPPQPKGISKRTATPPAPAPAPVETFIVRRWIPRLDGAPIAIVSGPTANSLSSYDPLTSSLSSWLLRDDHAMHDNLTRMLAPSVASTRAVIDRSWSVVRGWAPTGTLTSAPIRGWIEHARPVKIDEAGQVIVSPFHFDQAAEAGEVALAMLQGRTWQTTDHGESWIEVATPPHTRRGSGDLRACGAVGCELGPWIRVGWPKTPPAPADDPPRAVPPPSIRRAPLREIACSPAGAEQRKAVTAEDARDDVGLGASRLPVPLPRKDESEPFQYFKRFYVRSIPRVIVGAGDDERAVRFLLHGVAAEFAYQGEGTTPLAGITVLGPRRDANAYRRDLVFLDPLDPKGALRSVSYGASGLLAIAKSVGQPLAVLFPGEGPNIDSLVGVTSPGAGPDDVVVSAIGEDLRLIGVVHGSSLKLAGLAQESGFPVSAVQTSPNEIAVLMIGSDGSGSIQKVAGTSVSLLAAIPSPPSSDSSTVVPDALAIDEKGQLAILRVPSASAPPSANDPALLVPIAGTKPIALAPWSALLAADDPACVSDHDGYRATIHVSTPWLRLRGAAPYPSPSGTMSARVKWSPARVCLEALELPDGVRSSRDHAADIETEIVARFTSPRSAGRIGLIQGVELRQPLSCALP